jgi:apolipoprotein N-acyltransferase
MAIFRAVETRRWVVRAATTGISGVVAPDGRPQRLLGASQVGVLSADVGLPTTLTPYVRVGDVFAWSCVALALGALAIRRREALA